MKSINLVQFPSHRDWRQKINRSVCFLLLAISASLILTGCRSSQSSRAIFDNYLYRLANSLDIEREASPYTTQLISYPKKSALLYEIPPLKISILQFLQLSKCDLQRLIGQRNSSLGRLMTDYHSLLYEHEFLILAKRCRQAIAKDDSLYAVLNEAIAHKENYLNKLHWNAIFASDEVRRLFSLGSRVLTRQELSSNPVELIHALEHLHAWLADPAVDSQKLQQAYKAIGTRKYIGELRLTMALAVSALDEANTLINERLFQKPLCQNRRRNRRFDVVNRVFQLFYIGEVQPTLAKLHQQGQKLFSLVDQLQASLGQNQNLTTFWDKVYRSENSEWQNFNEAIATHTKAWQSLLRQCGSLPG